MKVPIPRRIKAWLVATVSLIAVTLIVVAPMTRPLAQSPTTYTFTDLGTLGGTYSRAFSINNCGQVVGESAATGASPMRPFLWRDANNNGFSDSGEMIDLGMLGGNSGAANDINSSGLVTGTASTSAGNRAFRWQDVNANGQSDPGEMIDLSSSSGDFFGFGVNTAGQIVGGIENSLVPSAFIWSSGTGVQPLPSPNPYIAYAINGPGQVVGYNGANDQAFVLTGTTYTYLPTFGGSRSIAYDINDTGHVVGMATLTGGASPPQHAFKWDGSSLQDLGVLAGGIRSTGFGINSAGVVVGFSDVTGGALHAFVHDGTMRDLNTAGVVTNLPVGWVLQQADEINDSGQIVGYGTNGSGDVHAFLLTPTGVTPPSCPLALPNVNVSVSPSSVNEDGGGSMTYTFTRSIVTASPLTVSFSTTGTAVANDYGISAVSNVVQIPASMPSATVTVTPLADTTDESNETVILTVTPDASYTVGTAATGTITDDDGIPTIQITSVTAPEPASGSTTFAFTVSLTNPSSSQITVNYATDTTGATATGGGTNCGGGVDFFNIPPTGLIFSAGETSKQVHVTVCSDSDLEPDETFFVGLSGNSPNSNLAVGTKGTGTITPQTPSIFVEQGTETNPIPTAAVVDSVTFARGPFRLTNNLNFSPDRLTRAILFTSNLGMTDANLSSNILTVNVAGYGSPLPIEHVGPFTFPFSPGFPAVSGSYIIVKLPDNLPNPSPGPNNLTLTVKMGNFATSNATILSITP